MPRHEYVVAVRRLGDVDTDHVATAVVAIEPDNIYHAGIDAELRALARQTDYFAGRRESRELGRGVIT